MRVVIIGAGIGGLSLALMLHARGVRSDIYEAAPTMGEHGGGITVLPHAVAELAELGLLARLDLTAVRTREIIYADRFGQEILREPRGERAGHQVPQLSIQRSQLQRILREAVLDRLGRAALHTGHVLDAFVQDEGAVTAWFTRRSKGDEVAVLGDLLVGCDGTYSAVRRQLYPSEREPRWAGFMMWRGAALADRFLDGRTTIIGGGPGGKLVVSPIAHITPATHLVHWGVTGRVGDDGTSPLPRRGDWTRRGRLDELLPHVRKFRMPGIDLVKLVTSTPELFEYPMVEREALARWTDGRVTLLGDAAHPMCPVDASSASHAIADARCLADQLVAQRVLGAALAAYESERIAKTADLARRSRPSVAEYLADDAIVNGYARAAAAAPQQVTRAG